MKCAYFFLSSKNDSKKDRVSLRDGSMWMIGVRDMDDAIETARELLADGFAEIELCGGFHAEGAKKLIDATDNQIVFNYAVHLPEQDDLYYSLFPPKKQS